MCCFRFKLWWMTQRMGTSGRDVPLETQFMLLESRPGTGGDGGGEAVYVVMLPLLEGQFRAALQGNDRDELEITLESGKHTPRPVCVCLLPLAAALGSCFSYLLLHVKPRLTCVRDWRWVAGAADILFLGRGSGARAVTVSRGQGGADGAGDLHGVRARRDQPF